MKKNLSLQQEILLLATEDDRGTFSSGMFLYSAGGAMVSELLLQQRIAANDDKKQTVAVIDESPTGDPLLDELLQLIRDSKKHQGLQHWVSKAANIKDLKHRIATQLCDLGILKQDERKILWLFTQKVYPELDGSWEDTIRQRMAEVMFDPKSRADARTSVLIALASHAGLLTSNFAKEEIRQHRKRIKQLAKGDFLAAGATQATIQAVQAAVVVAVMIPSIVVTTTH